MQLAYVLHVAMVARRGRAILLHDEWSGTRVTWRELPSAAEAFDPGVARTGMLTTALFLALAVLAGVASGGFNWKLLWTPPQASDRVPSVSCHDRPLSPGLAGGRRRCALDR